MVVGIAGDERTPMLVLGLRDAAGQLRTFGVTRTVPERLAEPIVSLLGRAGPAQAPIPSRWQHDQVPAWRPVAPEVVCEVRFSNLDLSVERVVADGGYFAHTCCWRQDSLITSSLNWTSSVNAEIGSRGG